MAQPTLLKTPIAQDGAKNTIPETTGSTTGLLSQQYGWQEINALPLTAGGIAPSRLDFNGVFNLLSNILFYAQKGWVWEFDETQNYFAGCTVKDTADGKTYVCIADVNASTTHPSSDTTHWKLSDLATKGDLANYLPLAGGAMTGNLRKNVTTSSLEIAGSTSSGAGAWLELFGKDHSSYPWTFMLQAGSTMASRLIGKSDGSLTWGGHNVLTDANGGYLPLAGGTMTGSLINKVDNSALEIIGAVDDTKGGAIKLFGKDYGNIYAGAVRIYTADANGNNKFLDIMSNGTLTWAGNDLGGSATVAKSLGTNGYIKRADGLILQWGRVDTVGTATELISFPISFSSNIFSIVLTREYTAGQTETGASNFVRRNNLSSFYIRANEANIHPMDWFAVGM